MSRTFALRRLAIAAAIATAATLGVSVVDGVVTSTAPAPEVVVEPVAPPELENDPQVSTSLQHVENAFGLFEAFAVSRSTATPDTRAPAVLLLGEDGGTKASQMWTVLFDPAQWDRKDSIHIIGVDVTLGYVTLVVASGDTFIVKAGQAFFIAGAPETLFAIDANGNVYQITTARAEGMRQQIDK